MALVCPQFRLTYYAAAWPSTAGAVSLLGPGDWVEEGSALNGLVEQLVQRADYLRGGVPDWIELTGGDSEGEDNPPTASPEEAEAGTVTELRSWSPALIAVAIEALAPGGGGEGEDNPPTASPEEAEAGTVTDLRSWSPALIAAAIEALAPGGGGGRWYEREAWGPDEELTEETERDLFLVGGPGTIEWAEVETLVQNNPPTIRLLVNGVWHGPAIVPNSGSGALRVGGAAMSVAVVAGDRISAYCLHDGGVYSSLAAKGLRVGVQVKPT